MGCGCEEGHGEERHDEEVGSGSGRVEKGNSYPYPC